MPLSTNSLMFLCTFSPLSLLFNDLVLQKLPNSDLLPVFVHWDDVFKMLWFMPMSAALIYLVDLDHRRHTESTANRFVHLMLVGAYFYGMAINHTHNALSNYLEKRAKVAMPAEVEAGIYCELCCKNMYMCFVNISIFTNPSKHSL
jgi:hypothetical protein